MKRSVLILMAVLIAVPVMAQQYGSLAGSVVDNQKQALPGVSVTLAGQFMQGSRAAVTDAQGRYRFVPVPPGSGYTLKFVLQSFNTLEKTDLVVNLGKETTVNAEMSLSQFAETITVTAEKIVVDTTKSTVDTTVDWKLADTLSNNRLFQTLMQMAPGVKAGNNPFVHGAADDQNLYLIDGVDTSDPKTKTWGTAINYDTIQEAQVQTGAYMAEYGRATGGIINLVTKSGGNNFSVTARIVKQSNKWKADPGIEKETGKPKTATISTDEMRPNGTIGGPIVKDAVWFYVAYERRNREQTFGRYPTLADANTGTTVQEISNYKGHYFSGKLTFQANPSHSFVAFYNTDPIDINNVGARYDYGPSINKSAEYTQFQGGNNYSAQWYGVLSPSLFLEAKYQYHAQELNQGAQGPGFGTDPMIVDRLTQYRYGAALSLYNSDRTRKGGLLNASYFLESGAGSHQLKAGIEFLDSKPNSGTFYNPAGQYYVGTTATPGIPYRRYIWYNQVKTAPTEQNYWALFVQDAWKLSRLTINLGFRAEQVGLKNNSGAEVVKFKFADQFSPRLGFAYDLGGDSVHGSASRFYDLISDYVAEYTNNTPNMKQRWDWNKTCTYDPAKKVNSYPDSCWTLKYDIPVGGSSTTIDPKLKPGYLDEFTLGYDKLLSNQLAAGINYVWRQQKRQVDWYDPTGSGEYLITDVPKKADVGDLKWNEYQAIELTFKKRFAADGFQFLANYTYVLRSRAWLRFGGSTGFVFTDPDSVNPLWYGEVESPHEVKFNGSWTAPWKTIFGVSAFWNSGNVYTPYHAGDFSSVPEARRGSLRVGNTWDADVHLEHPVKVGPLSLALYVDMFNAFNNQQATKRSGNHDSSQYKLPTGWNSPRQFQLGFKIDY